MNDVATSLPTKPVNYAAFARKAALFYAIFAAAIAPAFWLSTQATMLVMLGYFGINLWIEQRKKPPASAADVPDQRLRAEVLASRGSNRFKYVVAVAALPVWGYAFIVDHISNGTFGLIQVVEISIIHAMCLWALFDESRE
jgi:hypothetical protein